MAHDLKKIGQTLQLRRDELVALSKDSEADRKPVELDQQSIGRLSRMDALQMQAMTKATDRRRVGEIKQIDAALERLETGDYGFCVSCGEDIDAKRLLLNPANPVCIDCARGRT